MHGDKLKPVQGQGNMTIPRRKADTSAFGGKNFVGLHDRWVVITTEFMYVQSEQILAGKFAKFVLW